MDKNQVVLQGRIGSVFKEGKTQSGTTFIYFGIDIESRANATSTDNNYSQTLKVMVFKPRVIEYLRRVKARTGNTVVVFGFLSSFYDEVNGRSILVNALNGNEVLVVKTKPDNE